jgi:hypothetical protein
MKILDLSDSNEYSLCFLRPAPPKMMIQESVIRKRMFPLYESSVPTNYVDSSKAEVRNNMS